MKVEEEIYQENFISCVGDYYELTPTYEHKGTRKLCHDFNEQKSNRQTNSHEDFSAQLSLRNVAINKE